MMPSTYPVLSKYKLSAMLISHPVNIRYLTGFRCTYGFLLVGRRKRHFFTDSRYYERAKKEIMGAEVVLIDNNWPDILRRYNIKRLGFEAQRVSYALLQKWKNSLAGIDLVPMEGAVEDIRQIKTFAELKKIKTAVRYAENVLAALKIAEWDSEEDVAWQITGLMRDMFRTEPSFPPITAFGTNSSVPHAAPGKKKLRGSRTVLIDMGARAGGYSSDLTRTFRTGRITGKFKEIYSIVLEAQEAAIDTAGPGVKASFVDSAARDCIRRYGYGEYFKHSLGHGIGMDVHELPYISPGSKAVLKEGMVFSVEPGIYIPGWGGVRIEDMVLVTGNGCEVLTFFPKTLEDISI